MADALAKQLPDRIELDDARHVELPVRLHLTGDRLFDALGGEL